MVQRLHELSPCLSPMFICCSGHLVVQLLQGGTAQRKILHLANWSQLIHPGPASSMTKYFFGVESIMRVNAASLDIRDATTLTPGTLNDLTTDLIMANNNNNRAGEVGSLDLRLSRIFSVFAGTGSILRRCRPEGIWCDAVFKMMVRKIFFGLSSIFLRYRSQLSFFRLKLVRWGIGLIVKYICNLMRIEMVRAWIRLCLQLAEVIR